MDTSSENSDNPETTRTELVTPALTWGAAVFGVALFAISLAATVQALGFPGRAGLAPLTVGIPTTLLLVVVLFFEFRKGKPIRDGYTVRANPYIWLGIYVAVFYLFGAVAALAALTVGLVRVRGERPWRETLIFTIISVVCFFLLTEVFLGESLYRGILFEWTR